MSRFAYHRIFLAVALLGAAAQADDAALPAKSGLATDLIVNGQPIPENHVRLMAASFNTDRNGKTLSAGDARAAARSELITEELLAQEARKSGLDKKPAVADQLAFQQREILSRAYLEDYFAREPVTEASVKSAYEWKRANGKILEYKLRQILVPSPEEAAQVIDKLNKGEDFVALAKLSTRDPGGQSNGGDLGWFRPDIFVDHHFTDAVEALKKGEYNKTPVRSRFGWHVIRLEDGPRPVANPEPFDALDDSVKEALRQKTAQVKIEQLTARLAANAKVSGPGASAVKGTQ